MTDLTQPGETTIAIGVQKGRVEIRFHKPLDWCSFEPEEARQIGEAIAKAAFKARYGSMPINGGGSQITAQIRDRLVTRVMMMSLSMNEQGKSREFVARQIVDTVLSEVA